MKNPFPIWTSGAGLLAWALAWVPVVRAEFPQYSVTKLEDWWGGSDSSGYGVFAAGLNNHNDVLALDSRGRTLESYHFQIWEDGQRTDTGPATYPTGYGYTGTSHVRNFDDSGRIALDIYRSSDESLALAIQNVKQGTTIQLPDIPSGAVMDGSAPALSGGGNFFVARSDDNSRGWLFDTGSGNWTEMMGPGYYLQPDAVNNLGEAAGRMANAGGQTVPFVYTEAGGVQQITNGGTEVYGNAIAMNNAGLVTGTVQGRAFVFNSSTLEFEFITPAVGLDAADINDAGAIIGATHFGGTVFGIPNDAAFYWDVENGLTGFDNLLGAAVDDWFIIDAWDINNEGWVLGTAYNRQDKSNYQVLLRPVPEPSAALLTAATGFWWISRRRPIKRTGSQQ